MNRSTPLLRAAATTAMLLAWQPAAFAGTDTLYSGRATVIDVSLDLLTSHSRLILGDTGELDPMGAPLDDTVLTVDNPQPIEIHSATISGHTEGASDTSTSSARVEALTINLGDGLIITADVLQSFTSATCTRESMTVATAGHSLILNLAINGNPIPIEQDPNSRYEIPGLVTIIANEQYNPDANTIAVNALHVIVPGAPGVASADIVISHAQSGIIHCPCHFEGETPPDDGTGGDGTGGDGTGGDGTGGDGTGGDGSGGDGSGGGCTCTNPPASTTGSTGGSTGGDTAGGDTSTTQGTGSTDAKSLPASAGAMPSLLWLAGLAGLLRRRRN